MSCSIVQFFWIAYDFDAHRVSVLLCLFPLVARLNLLTVAEPSGLQPMNSAALLCGVLSSQVTSLSLKVSDGKLH